MATDLVLECAVKSEKAGSVASQFTKRIEIVMEPRYFKRYRDDGSGFHPAGDGFPVFISRAMIVFQDGAEVKETYDRSTSDYLYEDLTKRRQITGRCKKLVDKTENGAQ